MKERQKKIIQHMYDQIVKEYLDDIRICIDNNCVFDMVQRIIRMNKMKKYMKELDVVPHFHTHEDVETMIQKVEDYCRTHNIRLEDYYDYR